MKFLFLILLVILFLSCGENTSNKQANTDTINKSQNKLSSKHPSPTMAIKSVEILSDSVSLYRYSIKDTLKEDLNCDGFVDNIYFSEKSSVRHIVFLNGKTNEENILGQSLSVKADLDSDYSWVDFWGITKDTTTWEAIVDDGELLGSRTITLRCSSIVLRKEEAGGGIITFKDGGFRWVHQAD